MIHFGTAGWRGIIGEDFTFRNVRLVTQAIADYLLEEEASRPLVVGYDTRFLSEKFAAEAVTVLSQSRIPTLWCNRDTPTPTISFSILKWQADGALNFTASHNPAEYNGLKLSAATGAPVLPEVTANIENRIRELETGFRDEYFRNPHYVVEIAPAESYLAHLRQQVDLDAIAAADLKIGVDALYGTGREYLDRLFQEGGVRTNVIHNFRDPYFGGYSPKAKKQNLEELRKLVVETDCDLGLATDNDCDRFGVLDIDGTFINPNDVLALLTDYVLGVRGQSGDIARSVATTHTLDRIAAIHGVSCHETPVGFKYIGELLNQGAIVFGGEESAGLSMAGHLPKRDGILACLLVAEMAAQQGVSLQRQLEALWGRVGRSVHLRRDYLLTPAIDAHLQSREERVPDTFADHEVVAVNNVDGVKLLLGDRWFLYRRSGTEAALRCYAEAPTRAAAEKLHVAGHQLLFGELSSEQQPDHPAS